MAKRLSYDTKVGKLHCDVIGELEGAKAIIMTIHDLGCNSTSWHHFVENAAMSEVSTRAVWFHVNLPGQEDDAQDFPQGKHQCTMHTRMIIYMQLSVFSKMYL